MKLVKYISITVVEPFSGGSLRVCDGALRIFPNICLYPLPKPDYTGISMNVVRFLAAKREPKSYTVLYTKEDLPWIPIKHKVNWQIKGEPKENVMVDITIEEM